MRYITKKDEELIKTINLIFNFPVNSEKILNELEKNYKKNTDDPEAAFSFGFYNFLITSRVKNSTIGSERIELIFEAYNDALRIAPDYWLVWMFKAILLLALPEVMRDEDELVRILEKLISDQQMSEKQQPYFIVPYIIYADYNFSCNNPDGALKLIEEARKNVIKKPVGFKYLNDYFSMPFKDFLKRLVRSNERALALMIMELGREFFPDDIAFNQSIEKEWL
ncbi:hypothetical protein [Ruminiclostridium papyrosolvens]|uniref:Uncharacterized protein n=1 Tax=Ruminiclostridium papyrosolvens C7 TaxID=1330534 RepID=U4R062_9FIRM|nr:hypothetical protein [Ruminiclostridium papyrosolvens]EPR10511.1 hypothetical protein L323_13025 [Ruminiclostridium papyrosolvens C7]